MSDQWEPASFAELYPGRFLNAADLGTNRPTVTIERVWIETLEGEQGAQEKVIISFAGKKKAYVLPKINAISIAKMFGNDVKAWKGKRIVLYVTADLMALRGEPCVRVWGSPDIERDLPVEWKPAKRKPVRWTLRATGGKPASAPAPAADGVVEDDAEPFM